MRRAAAVASGALVVCALLIAPSVAQGPVTKIKVDAKVVPNKAGTPKKPQGVELKIKGSLTTTEGFEKPIVEKIVTFFPHGGNYNGGEYPKCSWAKINKPTGPDGCPKQSIMGGGYAIAYADTVLTRATITVVNGGDKASWGYVTLYNPALVQKAVRGDIKKLKGGKWKYRVTVKIPEVLQVVAGVPIAPRNVVMNLGGKPYAKNWIETTSCPKSKRWAYHVDVTLLGGKTIPYDGSSPCR